MPGGPELTALLTLSQCFGLFCGHGLLAVLMACFAASPEAWCDTVRRDIFGVLRACTETLRWKCQSAFTALPLWPAVSADCPPRFVRCDSLPVFLCSCFYSTFALWTVSAWLVFLLPAPYALGCQRLELSLERRELLDNVNWTQQMDFELTRSAALNPDNGSVTL